MFLRIPCRERDGFFVRTVHSIPKDPELIWRLYDKVKGMPNFVTADVKAFTPESMIWLFNQNTRIYLVDDVGVVVLLHHGNSVGEIHMTFWDRKLRGREDMAKRVLLNVMHEEGLRYILTHIPPSSRVVLAFARRAGFKTVHTTAHAISMMFTYPPGIPIVLQPDYTM